MATGHSQPPAFLLSKTASPTPTDRAAEDRARKLARLEALAEHLRSAASLAPNDPELRARLMAAGTAAQQLASYLRRQGGAA